MAVVSSRNEPVRALLLTIGICQIAVLIGNVDAIAPLLRYVSKVIEIWDQGKNIKFPVSSYYHIYG